MDHGELLNGRRNYWPLNYHHTPHEAIRHYKSLLDGNYEHQQVKYYIVHIKLNTEKTHYAKKSFNRHYHEYSDFFDINYNLNTKEADSLTVWTIDHKSMKELSDYYLSDLELHRDYTSLVHVRYMDENMGLFPSVLEYQPLKMLY